MTDIATYKTAIKTWVEAQGSGITAQWRDQEGGWQPKTRARLHLSNVVPRGVDTIRYDQDATLAAGVDYIPTFSGCREITLSIEITSRDQSGSNVAIWYLDKLRRSLRKVSVRDALRAAGLGFATTGPTQDLSSLVDDRLESKAQMDVFFNAVVNEEDEDEADSVVETWKVTTDFTEPDGTTSHPDNGEEDYP